MPVTSLDHVALPTADAERLLAFYESLGFATHGVDSWREGRSRAFAIVIGEQKINVHPETLVAERHNPAYLRAPSAEPGCGDLCVVWEGGLEELRQMLTAQEVTVIAGPVTRDGGRCGGAATGTSVYVRDPDDNLIEFISYDPTDALM